MSKNFKIFALLALLVTIAFYDVVILGKTLKVTTANSQSLPNGVFGQEKNKPRYIPMNGTDVPVLEEPIYEFIKQNLARGILPLWNPHQACGYPLIAMLEVGIFFPLTWIIYLLPNIIAWDFLILTRILLAGLFTFWFMRRLEFKNVPSLCAAIAFMFSGPMILLQYWTMNVDLLLPLLLICIDQLVKLPNRKNVGFLSISVALTLFAGHPEHVFLVNAYGTSFFLFRVFTQKNTNKSKIFLSYFFAYLLGSGLAAIVLFPFLQNLMGEFWNGHPEGTGLLMEEQPARALSLALPHFFQKENLTFDFTFAGWWGGYLGVLPLGFAFLSLFKKQNHGLNYFFGGMALLIIGKEYGLPIINWLGYLPIFDVCRYAIHTPVLAAFTIAVLCGMGVHLTLNEKNIFIKGLLFSTALILVTTIHLVVLAKAPHINISIQASLFALGVLIIFQILLWLRDRNLTKPKAVGIAIVAVIFLELFLYIHREHPKKFDSFAKVPYIEFLKSQKENVRSYGIFWAYYPNTASGFQTDDLGYFFGLVPYRYVDFVNNLLLADHFQKNLRPTALRAMPIENDKRYILDLLNIRYIIAPEPKRLQSLLNNYSQIIKSTPPIYEKEVTIFERTSALPRAYVVHRVVFEPNKDKSLELIKKLGPSSSEGAVINEKPLVPILSLLQTVPLKDDSTVKIIQYSANEVVLSADMKNPGFVVLSDAYHPDWKVKIDGKKWKVFQTNYLVRSVFVPRGQHEIKFTFAPVSFFAGMGVSAISLFILAGLIFYRGRRFF